MRERRSKARGDGFGQVEVQHLREAATHKKRRSGN
jgi:hypothetical protein